MYQYAHHSHLGISNFNTSYWTSLTLYAWVVVHFLNGVASYSMYSRMEEKYRKLKEPPAYEGTYESSTAHLYTAQPTAVVERPVESLPMYK